MLVLTREAKEGKNRLYFVNTGDQPIVIPPGGQLGLMEIVRAVGQVRVGFDMPRELGIRRGEIMHHQPPPAAHAPVQSESKPS